MTEIFLNERRIILTKADDPDFADSGLTGIAVSDQLTLAHLVQEFLTGIDPVLALTGEPDWLGPAFQAMFLLLPAAGGIVKSDKGYLFIYRRNYWDLPKGKIDKGETAAEAALREVHEETGLMELSITGKLPTTWHIYQSPWEKDEGKWILKETTWFLMEGKSDEPLIPESGEDIEVARWVRFSELAEMHANTYASLQKIIVQIQISDSKI